MTTATAAVTAGTVGNELDSPLVSIIISTVCKNLSSFAPTDDVSRSLRDDYAIIATLCNLKDVHCFKFLIDLVAFLVSVLSYEVVG